MRFSTVPSSRLLFLKERLATKGAEPAPLSAVEFSKTILDEIVIWRNLIVERGIGSE